MMTKPRVSVCIPAYNHEKYVIQAIKSVLDQGIQDLEIVVTDDCSTDSTVSAIASIDDVRIRLFRHSHNQGPSVAANNNVINAAGEYICFLASDDIFLPGKIQKQLDVLASSPEIGAVFSYMQYVDEDGAVLASDGSPPPVVPPDNQEKILRQFFFEGNQLAAPTAMIRRKVLDQIGLFDPRLLQTQDFDLWVRLCIQFKIRVIREPLVQYRIRSGLLNADANTPAKIARIFWELPKVLERFCEIGDLDLLFRIFPEACELSGRGLSVNALLAFMAAKAPQRWTRTFGLDLLYREFADPAGAQKLRAAGFDYPALFHAAAQTDASGSAALAEASARHEKCERDVAEFIKARDWWQQQAENWQAEYTFWRARHDAVAAR